MRSTFILLLILIFTLENHVIAKKHHDHDGPDDALCTQFSGLNSTCSSCILQGCSYCDVTGTGQAGLCLSHKTAHDTCNINTTLISSFASLTQCRIKQHDLYESLSAFIPIIITILGLLSIILVAYYVRPSYATPAKTTIRQPSLPIANPHWYARITHLFRSNGIIYRVMMIGVFITVFVLAIITIGSGMWSIQIDGNGNKHHHHSWDTSTSAIAYNTWGLTTVTRNPSNHDDLIFRSSAYHCNNVNDDTFIRCSLHRVIASSAGVVAVMALTCLCIVAIQILISLLCCRSLSNYSVKYMSLAATLHLAAVMMYAGGAYLLQSRVYTDANHIKSIDATSPTPYHLYFGVSWNCCLAAAIINACALIPMTRGHIMSIEPPTKGRCCWRRRAQSNSEISASGQVQDDTHFTASTGVVVAVPLATDSTPYVPPVASTRYIYGVNNIQNTDQEISTHTNMYPTVATAVMMTTQNGYQTI